MTAPILGASVIAVLARLKRNYHLSNMPVPVEHTWFLFAYDYEWSALAAIGTLAAALGSVVAATVALVLPFRMRRFDRQEQKAKLRQTVRSLDYAVGSAIRLVDETPSPWGQADLAALAERYATGKILAETLRMLMTKEGLGTEPIAAAAAAANAMDALASMTDKIGTVNAADWAQRQHRIASTMAKEATDRIALVRVLYDLERADAAGPATGSKPID